MELANSTLAKNCKCRSNVAAICLAVCLWACLSGSHKIYKTLAQKYIYVSLPLYIESCLLLLVVGFLPACCEKFCSFCCQTFVVGNSRCFWPLVVWAGVRVCVCVCVTRSAIGPITLNECFADDREEWRHAPPADRAWGAQGQACSALLC